MTTMMTMRLSKPLVGLVAAGERVRRGFEVASRRMQPGHFALLYEISGARHAQAVYAAAELGIADVLEDAPLTAGEIATRVAADEDAVGRLLRHLTGRGVFRRTGDGRYTNSAMSDALREGSPVSMRAMAQLTGRQVHWEHWGRFVDAMRSGEPVVPAMRGMSLFEYADQDREFADVFDRAMTSVSNLAIAPVLMAYDFTHFHRVVDVGGGRGAFLAAILARSPAMSGVLFDLPAVTRGAPAVLAAEGVADRCEIRQGSFFDDVPGGGDAYVLKAVLHDWPDDTAVTILRRVRAAMDEDAVLLLVEMVLPDDDAAHPGHLLDLDMLVTHGGRERTGVEYRGLLRRAGFEMRHVTATMAPMSVIEALAR